MADDFGAYLQRLLQQTETVAVVFLQGVTHVIDAHYAQLHESLESSHAAMAGRNLSNEQVVQYEKALAADPRTLSLRIMLLGKYFDSQIDKNSPYRMRRYDHITWIVQNHPEHPIAGTPEAIVYGSREDDRAAYERIKLLWLQQTANPETTVPVLSNAASYFTLSDMQLAERCLKRALALEPSNTRIRDRLGHLYSLWDGHDMEALAYLEQAIRSTRNDDDRFHLLEEVPERAFKAKDFEKAATAADRLLLLVKKYRKRDSQDCGDAINNAHTILGRIALKNGNVSSAKFHLALSVIGAESPVNCSFGPNLELARDLLDVGERQAVLEYLNEHERLCGPRKKAFELRFEAEFGEKPTPANEEIIEQAFLDHKIEVIRSSSEKQSFKRLPKLIDRALVEADRCSNLVSEAQEEGDDKLIHRAEVRLHMYQDHVVKLKSIMREREFGSQHPDGVIYLGWSH